MKYAFVAAERTLYPVNLMCRVLDVSTSGFYAYVARQDARKADPDAVVRADLHTVHEGSRGTYGRPRLVRGLRACGHQIGPKRVQRLMQEEALQGISKGRYVPCTTDSGHALPVAPNVLARRFAVDADIEAWAADITYIPTRDGWLYLAIVIALRTRQILGYSLANHMRAELVEQAFRNAYATSPVNPGVIFHSDRGSQYASAAFTQALQPLGFIPSMSRKGNCWDNAVPESFFATLKTEEVNKAYEDEGAAHRGIASYIHGFYNPRRMHSSLGYLSPNDFARTLQPLD